MESQTSSDQVRHNNTLSILGAVLLLPSLLIWALWIQTFSANPSASPSEKVEIFLGFFPNFLRNVDATSKIVLLSSVAAIIVSAFGLRWASVRYKVLGIVVIVISSLVTLLQLFTMM